MDVRGAFAVSGDAAAGLVALADARRFSLAELVDPARPQPAAFAMAVRRLVEQATEGDNQVSRFQSAP